VTLTAVGLALAIGLGLGLLGGGGSIMAVPVFTFFLHMPPKDAIVASLAVVGVAAATGAAGALIRGVVPLGVTLTVGLAATAGAYAGGLAGSRLDDRIQLGILGVVMLGAAVAMWRRSSGGLAATRAAARRPILVLLGLGAGGLTGLVGVGGGFLIVPALVIGAGLPMQQAAGASLFVITLAALSGLAGYAGHTAIAWPFILPFAAVAAAGTLAGSGLAGRLPQRALQQAFAIALVVLGSYVLTHLG
jgi:uncharacterized protein